jgi:WD40 repeat protein
MLTLLQVAIDKRAPFHECNNEIQVMTSITSGKLPTKPDGAANGAGHLELLWDCCRACWNRDPVDRPTMAEARERLCAGSTVSDGPAHGWHIVQPKKAPGVERISKVPACSNCWLSPTGQYLAIRSEDQKTISFWETRTMSRCGPDCETEPDVFQLAWSPTEKHIVTSSKDGVHRKWGDIFESAKLVAVSTQKHENAKIEYSPDDRLIASFDRTAKLWDASNLSLVWQYSGYMSFSVAFHPLGRRVVFFDSAYLAIDVNAEDHGDITATERNLGLLVSRPVFDPSGNTCAVGTPEDVLILSADSFEETDLLPYRYVDAMRFTPDSKHILLVLESKMLVLWDIAASAVVQQFTIDIPEFYVWSAHISNDCRVVRVSDSKYTSHIIHLTY